MKNFFIDTYLENNMIYFVINTNDKEAKLLFPNGVKISGNKFMFKDTYSDTKKNSILESVNTVKKELSDFFDLFYNDSKSRKEKVKDNYSLLLCGNDIFDENDNYIFINYFRFIYTTLDLESLGIPFGISINYEVNFHKREDLNVLAFNLKSYFNKVFN